MKIGFVFDDTLDKPDGVQQYILTIGAWLQSQGHEVHYLVGATTRTDLPHVHSMSRNVQVRFNGNRLSIPLPANKRAIRELLTTEQFDILHVQMPYSPMMAARVVRLAKQVSPRTSIVGTFHILPYSRLVRWATRALGLWLRSTLRYFDRVVAVSPAAQEFATQAFALQRCEVLPNVADIPRFAQAEANAHDVSVITFLGRLVPRKGCMTLLQAVAEVRSRPAVPQFKVVIAGRGPLLEDLQATATRLGVSEMINFAGFIKETAKPGLIASSDIMVFPSSGGESFGIVLIEAMAAGRPLVLAGDNPGYRSVMGERPELLFPATDAHALADKLEYYLTDEGACSQAIAWQMNYVRQFDVAFVGNELVELYRSTLVDKVAQ